MRCTPMAVWTSSIANELADVEKAVVTEVTFTHPSKVVHGAIYVYQSAIHVLLNNPNEQERAMMALTHAIKVAETVDQTEKENCKKWLQDAVILS